MPFVCALSDRSQTRSEAQFLVKQRIMSRSCHSATRSDFTPPQSDSQFRTAYDHIRSQLDVLQQNGYFLLPVAKSFPQQMDVCDMEPNSACSTLNDSSLLTPDCLSHLCAAVCIGNDTMPTTMKQLNYHASSGNVDRGRDNTHTVIHESDRQFRLARRELSQWSIPAANETAEEQFFQLPRSDVLCCHGHFCEDSVMCQSAGTECAGHIDAPTPACLLPDPLLLIPVQFSLVISNSEASGTLDALHIGRTLGQQLGILNQAFRGHLEDCTGECVDTRIHFTAPSCMGKPHPCTQVDWQIIQVAAASSQVKQLLFGASSNEWLQSHDALAAMDQILSAVSPYPGGLNVLVLQDDKSLVRMRATWPWHRSFGNGMPFQGVAITSSGLPGVVQTGAFTQGKSLVHAVGHWLGLLHTYHVPEGADPCAWTNHTGDFVADTPQLAMANTLSCQVTGKVRMPCLDTPDQMFLDSCPCAPGLDAVTNFMDEGPDSCLRTFSQCQGHRMHGAYWKYLASERNGSNIHDMVLQTRRSRAVALANGHMIDELQSPSQMVWDGGWCALRRLIESNKAVSLGASVGVGVLVWAAAVVTTLAIYSFLRQKHGLRTRLHQVREREDAIIIVM
eukprot:jgi/Ulvmu1/7312/UM035_0101.1